MLLFTNMYLVCLKTSHKTDDQHLVWKLQDNTEIFLKTIHIHWPLFLLHMYSFYIYRSMKYEIIPSRNFNLEILSTLKSHFFTLIPLTCRVGPTFFLSWLTVKQQVCQELWIGNLHGFTLKLYLMRQDHKLMTLLILWSMISVHFI